MKNKKCFRGASMSIVIIIVFLIGAMCSQGMAQSFPSSPITIILPFGPGGGGDLSTRLLIPDMQKYLKVPIVPNNIPGGGGLTGMITLWRSKPDGHTIGMNHIQTNCSGELFGNAEYKVDNFEIIGQFVYAEYVLAVPKNSPFLSVRDFKKAKKPVRFATMGMVSSSSHAALALGEELDFPVFLVSGYTGSMDSIVGAMKGEADAVIYGAALKPFFQNGDLIPLLALGNKRIDYIPNTPTLREEGISTRSMHLGNLNYALWAPPRTPKERVGIIAEAMIKAVLDKKEALIKMNLNIDPVTGEKAKELVRDIFNTLANSKTTMEKYMKTHQ